jgi:hypothetical protein
MINGDDSNSRKGAGDLHCSFHSSMPSRHYGSDPGQISRPKGLWRDESENSHGGGVLIGQSHSSIIILVPITHYNLTNIYVEQSFTHIPLQLSPIAIPMSDTHCFMPDSQSSIFNGLFLPPHNP